MVTALLNHALCAEHAILCSNSVDDAKREFGKLALGKGDEGWLGARGKQFRARL